MNRLNQFVGYLLVGIGLASAQAHASIIQSMTIEEIGAASGGLGSSATSSGGGTFSFLGNMPENFNSMGSTDGAILMGVSQGNTAFTPGFPFIPPFGFISPNTLASAPSATIGSSGNLLLDISGWGIDLSLGFGNDFSFPMAPDIGTLITNAAAKDATSYFYTADWTHVLTINDDPSGAFVGATAIWHLEGVAAVKSVPEPGTFWLVGITLMGLFGVHRRKRV